MACFRLPIGPVLYGGERVRWYGGDGVVGDIHIDWQGFDDHVEVQLPDGSKRIFLSSQLEVIDRGGPPSSDP